MAAAGERTLVVDLDPQGNATSGRGFEAEAVQPSVYDALVGSCRFEEVVHKGAHFSMLDVIPSTPDLVGAEIELVGLLSRESVLKRGLSALADQSLLCRLHKKALRIKNRACLER